MPHVTSHGCTPRRRHAALFAGHAVKTDSAVGLTMAHAADAIRILARPPVRTALIRRKAAALHTATVARGDT